MMEEKNIDTEEEFLDILSNTRADYESQEKEAKTQLKTSTYIRAGCLVLIPVATFWNWFNGGIVIILTAIISFTEFYVKFNRLEEKLHLLNIAITNLNNEYYNYYYDCKDYSNIDDDKKLKTFIENATFTIKDTELKLNNNYDTDATKKIDYKAKG